MITASIVLYNTPKEQLDGLLGSIERSSVPLRLFVVDNSPDGYHSDLSGLKATPYTYLKTQQNRGYGAGHNIALQRVLESSKFHFVLNPDIRFGATELEKMIEYLGAHDDIGQLMPKVVYPDGTLQYLCKLIPTPLDLILRLLSRPPLRSILQPHIDRFELRFTGYNRVMDVPYLSGCFMLFRTSALKAVGLFDERFFMYPEDIDLTRRMRAHFRTVFYPGAVVIHEHAKASHKDLRFLWIHAKNMVIYFNKWGWIIDRERAKTNQETLRRLQRISKASSEPI